ncbi:MAG: hypothetical protein LBK83_11160 [Treponema sp.]|jgi:hypothetical protein|nr:hypothetical protein [Treponema sp.]
MGREEVNFVSGFHLKCARQAVASGDFSKARYEYRRSVNVLKNNNVSDPALFAEYEEFVKRDPYFEKLANVFIAGIRDNPGIMQSDIFLMDITKDWGEKYGLGKSVEPIDKKYFFDFAEKLGYITTQSDGKDKRIFVVG